MKVTLLAFLLCIPEILHSITLTCNIGKGSMTNPCYINVYLLPFDDKIPILIDIPSNIEYAIINCGRKSCQNRVTAYLGAIKTRILCPEPDSCYASKFYCARGPPDSIQDNYRGNSDKEPECILEIHNGISSVAKDAEFAVFEHGHGMVDVVGDSAFSGGNYRCYSDYCELKCLSKSACNDVITYIGTKTVKCIGDCSGLALKSKYKSPLPIIATPDIQGNCVINPKDIIGTTKDVAIVFTNKCETATLNCINYNGICEKRKIYCSADDECHIICRGIGVCKEATMIFGPPIPNNALPRDVNEAMFDRDSDTKPDKDKLKVFVTLDGPEACPKCIIDSVLSNTVINAVGSKTFTEGSVNCGFIADDMVINRVTDKGSCDLICTNNGEAACDKCMYTANSAIFSSIGTNCINTNNAYRMKSINNDPNINNLDVLNSNNSINNSYEMNKNETWAIIVTLITILLVGIIITCVYFKYNSTYIINEKTGLISDTNKNPERIEI